MPELASAPEIQEMTLRRSASMALTPATPVEPTIPLLSSEWRISGKMTSAGRAFVLLVNGAGVLRAVPASSFTYTGMLMSE